MLSIFLGLVASAGIYYYWRGRALKTRLEKERVERELAHRTEDVRDMAQELAHKQELASEILEATEANQVNLTEGESEAMSAIKERLRAQIRVDEQRAWLRQEIESVNTAFFERLKESHGNLVKTEVELCSLLRVGLGNREVADLRNISPSSARIARYRLKKKLGLNKETDVAEYLKQL